MTDSCDPGDLADWLRLALIPGLSGADQRHLLKAFGLPRHIFAASAASLRHTLPAEAAEHVHGHDNRAEVEAALAWAAEPGNRILTLADADYPQQLLDIHDPPTLIYAKGRVELLRGPALAVVGSRNATPQGCEDAQNFAAALSAAGLTIVSGLALGIDAAAHRGALGQAASTVAVIGTGIDRVYPAKNRDLALKIAESGLIVSEFPLESPPLAHHFPRRNRLISGLSLGCLVVEATLSSGSLITARLAAEQGREVFAIPGSIHSPFARGCHRLIRDGAKLVECAEDVLSELRLGELALRQRPPADAPARGGPETEGAGTENDGTAASPVLAALGHDPCGLDALAARTGLTADALSAMLLQLELEGRIASLPGGRYQRLR